MTCIVGSVPFRFTECVPTFPFTIYMNKKHFLGLKTTVYIVSSTVGNTQCMANITGHVFIHACKTHYKNSSSIFDYNTDFSTAQS